MLLKLSLWVHSQVIRFGSYWQKILSSNSQGRGWRFDSRLWNLLSTWQKTCEVVNCLMCFGAGMLDFCLKKKKTKDYKLKFKCKTYKRFEILSADGSRPSQRHKVFMWWAFPQNKHLLKSCSKLSRHWFSVES